jgi:hypothetical protein
LRGFCAFFRAFLLIYQKCTFYYKKKNRYVYYSTFVAAPRLTAAGVLAAVARLPVAEQVAVARQILAAAGVGA